jgi:hypothetical protein
MFLASTSPLSNRGGVFRAKIDSLGLMIFQFAMNFSVQFRSLLCTTVFLGGGYTFATVNHAFQLPMIRYFAGENLLYNDLLMLIIPAYTTYFYKGIAVLGLEYAQIEILFFALYVASMYLFSESLIRLFDLIGKRAHISLIAALAVAAGFMPAMGLDPWQHKLDHSVPGLAMAGWALYLFVAGRERWAFALLGFLFNLHALYSAHLFIVFGAYQIFRFQRDQLWLNVQLVALFSLLSFPVVIWKLSSMAADTTMDAAWLQILHERIGNQIFVSDVSYWWIATFLIFICLIALGWRVIFSERGVRGPSDKLRFVLSSALALTAVQIILTECWPVRIALEGQFWRLTQWFAVAGVAVVMLAVERRSKADGDPMRLVFGSTVICLLMLGSLVALFAALVGFALLTLEKGRRYMPLGLVLLLGVLGVTGAMQWYWWKPDWTRAVTYPGGRLPTTAMAGMLLIYLLAHEYGRRTVYSLALLLAVGAYVYLEPAQFSVKSGASSPWRETQLWVRDHSEVDAIILTPPELTGFRIYSDRAVVGEFKDGGMVNNNKEFALRWRERMRDLGMTTSREFNKSRWRMRDPNVPSSYRDKSGAELATLARRYDAQLIVTRAEQQIALPERWANERFRVYSLP